MAPTGCYETMIWPTMESFNIMSIALHAKNQFLWPVSTLPKRHLTYSKKYYAKIRTCLLLYVTVSFERVNYLYFLTTKLVKAY